MSWAEKVVSLKGFIGSLSSDPSWATSQVLTDAISNIVDHLDEDLQELEDQAAFLRQSDIEPKSYTAQTIDLFRYWHLKDRRASLCAISIFAIEYFELEKDELHVRAILTAAILAEVENDLPYHSNMHFRKVLVHTIGLIAVHNRIFADTAKTLTTKEISLILIAAIIHDLGHDGHNNSINGVHHMGRMERRSFELAVPFIQKTGLEQSEIDAVSVMLLTTDVSPIDSDTGANSQLRKVYRKHHGEDVELALHGDLKALEDDERLTLIAMLLHEADIATSAGLSYEVTKFETGLFAREIGKESAHPHLVIDFLEKVCERRMLSHAAQKLFAANMARVYILAQEDLESGNQAYPQPEHSNFILNIATDEGDSVNRTIN